MIAPAVHFINRDMGEGDIPDDVKHVTIDESVTVIPILLFAAHQSIVDLICGENVKKIGFGSFSNCPRLERVVMPGVEVAEGQAFSGCKSLRSIKLPSARIVEGYAFNNCEAMEEVTFGKDLESIGFGAFLNCPSLERITIPLKNGLFTEDDNTFQGCANLGHVTLVEEKGLDDTVAALFLEDWRNEMRTVIDSINHDLPNATAGAIIFGNGVGEKTIVIRSWIKSVLSKIIHYKAQHRGLLIEVEASIMQLGLPDEIVRNNVLPFLELPAHTFHGEDNTVVINPNLADLELSRELDANATGVVRNNVDGEESMIKPKVINKTDKGGDKDGWLLWCFLIPLTYCILIATAHACYGEAIICCYFFVVTILLHSNEKNRTFGTYCSQAVYCAVMVKVYSNGKNYGVF